MMAAREARCAVRLSELLAGLVVVPAAADVGLCGLALDSRQVHPGFLFLACRGGRGHGLDFVDQAVARGAAAVAWEPGGAWGVERVRALGARLAVPLVAVESLGQAASLVAARFFGDPSARLRVVGITGTNGKTSCSHFLARAMAPELPCVVIGTLGNGFPEALDPASHTTPDAVRLQQLLSRFHEQGARAVSMEVSSHALDQGRAAAVRFDVAVLTNLSHDHLDYHGAMAAYAAAKKRLFTHPGLRVAVLNHDDPFGRELLAELAPGVEAVLYGVGPLPRLPGAVAGWVWAREVRAAVEGLRIRVSSSWGDGELRSPLLGDFNAGNLLAVLGVLLHGGVPLGDALARLAVVPAVPGRMERLGGGDRPTVVVDYAHTPDALEQALRSLRAHCRGRLICVLGCGGERDRAKRPSMGAVAERGADLLVITDDNPRGEDGDRIVAEILGGVSRPGSARVQRDRATAIRLAVGEARQTDWVLVAGKGHETTQTYGELILPFSDREQALAALTEHGKGAAWTD